MVPNSVRFPQNPSGEFALKFPGAVGWTGGREAPVSLEYSKVLPLRPPLTKKLVSPKILKLQFVTILLILASHSEHVSVLRLLIDKRDVLFEVPSVELHDVYLYLQDHFPDVLDALLRRRSALAGLE